MSDQRWQLTLYPPPQGPRLAFLTGLFATWLAGERKPTKPEREQAERAARAALDVLVQP